MLDDWSSEVNTLPFVLQDTYVGADVVADAVVLLMFVMLMFVMLLFVLLLLCCRREEKVPWA